MDREPAGTGTGSAGVLDASGGVAAWRSPIGSGNACATQAQCTGSGSDACLDTGLCDSCRTNADFPSGPGLRCVGGSCIPPS